MKKRVKRLYLASKSRRRILLMKRLNLEFTVLEPRAEEIQLNDPKSTVLRNASSKAWSVSGRVEDGCVVAADTAVYLNGRILGKPSGLAEAKAMLEELSGRWHTVFTGLSVLILPEGREYRGVEETRVKFKRMAPWEIEFYLATGEPLDKAGGYGIQGYGSLFIERIVGCYFNVVGFPLHRLYMLLREAGLNLLDYVKLNR